MTKSTIETKLNKKIAIYNSMPKPVDPPQCFSSPFHQATLTF